MVILDIELHASRPAIALTPHEKHKPGEFHRIKPAFHAAESHGDSSALLRIALISDIVAIPLKRCGIGLGKGHSGPFTI